MFELKMPKLGESVTEGPIGKWLKKPGEQVNKYDLLVEVQTDKVNTEIPSPVAGTLREVKVEEGQTVPIGSLRAIFDTADSETAAASPAAGAPASASNAAASSPSAAASSQSVTAASGAASELPGASAPRSQSPAQSGVTAPAARTSPAPAGGGMSAPMASGAGAAAAGTAPRVSAAATAPRSGNGAPSHADLSEVRATPAVRKLASENGVDISEIEGTGLGGRVSRRDVEDFIAQRQATPQQQATAQPSPATAQPAEPRMQPTPQQQAQAGQVVPAQQTQPARAAQGASLAGDTLVPLTQMRRAIANNMVQAWSAPHAHAVMPVDVTELMKYRDKVRHEFQEREGFDLSPAAFIAKAVVEAARAVPGVNASWTDQGLVLHRQINLGYAVALGEDGLIVPVIKDADGRSLAGLMRAIRDVVDRAKARRLTMDDLTGGTFTLNNTGPLGTIVSSPIVPPGQAAIMSSESIRKALTVTDDDAIAIRQIMNIVIGFDHRVIDGSTAARFLTAVRDWLQDVGPSVTVY
ncbi:MAG TPA: dihydrolipoamide acetyltransferase family protein [Candidatus Limnocylindrales bacterium]|nr:dihydrolipoamide acetyltransferase family protein [Candidatus Limnocylindrales bacterium]